MKRLRAFGVGLLCFPVVLVVVVLLVVVALVLPLYLLANPDHITF